MTKREDHVIDGALLLACAACAVLAAGTAAWIGRYGLFAPRAPVSAAGTGLRLVFVFCAAVLFLVRSDRFERIVLLCAIVAGGSTVLFGFGVGSPELAATRLLSHLLAYSLGGAALLRLWWARGRDRRSLAADAARTSHENTPSISVVIPAFNEEAYLGDTLDRLRAAEAFLGARTNSTVEIVVVDNGSTDRTVVVARERGARVITETERKISRVRNTGARSARHDVLVFLDADTLVPPELLARVALAMREPSCAGGSVDILHQPNGVVLRAYFGLWRAIGLLAGLAQGACQFCRRDVFVELGGYDETIYMGEDVDFFIRLHGLARRHHLQTSFISDLQVVPSTRRFDQWPVWRTLLLTNPFLVMALRRRRSPWVDWYENVLR